MAKPINIRKTSDAVFVTRCKDCVHFAEMMVGFAYCKKLTREDFFFISSDWFCKDGQPRWEQPQKGTQDD